MFERREKPPSLTNADEMGKRIVRAGSLNEKDAEQAVSAPFLFARVRANIAEESSKRQSRSGILQGRFMDLAELALAVLVVAAAGVFWSSRAQSLTATPVSPKPDTVVTLTACSVSASDRCVISTGQVVQLVMNGTNANRE